MLFYEAYRHGRPRYLIDEYASYWREDGHEVVSLYGVADAPRADVLFVHVDLSVVPEPYLEFCQRYPVSINGKVRDIRKASYSCLRVAADDDYQGPVVVKSNYNFAARPERALGMLRSETNAALSFRSPADYRVYPSVDQVPIEVFVDPALIVERFVPEQAGGLYHTRLLLFLGERYSCTRIASKHPIVNSSSSLMMEAVPAHPDILALREAMGFDYGKFDYVERDGKAILLDANKTVGAAPPTSDPELLKRRRYRAGGLYDLLEKKS